MGAGGGSLSSAGYSIVLASTGRMHRHTRLHTFRSDSSAGGGGSGNSSTLSSLALRSAFSRPSDKTGSFIELPGSVEFAELQSCNDNFALQTETGIYYGAPGTASSGVLDAGMLTYDSLQQASIASPSSASHNQQHRESVILPASIGRTPHHFITLSSTNNVKFVNRIATQSKVLHLQMLQIVMYICTDNAAASSKALTANCYVCGWDYHCTKLWLWLRNAEAMEHTCNYSVPTAINNKQYNESTNNTAKPSTTESINKQLVCSMANTHKYRT